MSTASLSLDSRGPRRRAIVVLLAVNLFLAGLVAALFVRLYWGEAAHHGRGSPSRRIEVLANLLPPIDAEVLRREFAKSADAIERASASFAQARERIRASLRSDPFDPAATRTAMAEATAAHARLEDLMQEVILSAAAKMSADGRLALAARQSRPKRAPPRTIP